MCDNWLSNRVFGTYDEIVDHYCDAWNKLVEQPWRIMSPRSPRLDPPVLITESSYYASPRPHFSPAPHCDLNHRSAKMIAIFKPAARRLSQTRSAIGSSAGK